MQGAHRLKITISPRRRELILKAANNDFECLHVIHLLTNHVRCDEVLTWLIQNRITGQNLTSWFLIKWQRSVLSLIKYVLMRIDSDVQVRPIFLGRDFIP